MNALGLSSNQQYSNKKTITIMPCRMINLMINSYNVTSVSNNTQQYFKYVVIAALHHEEITKDSKLISKLLSYGEK